MVPPDHLKFFQEIELGPAVRLLVNSGNFKYNLTFLLRTYVLPVMHIWKQICCWLSLISGLDFDTGGREQGCRNPRNLTECKILYKDNLKHVQGTAKRNT